jgi:hypothetical protein
MFVVLKTTKYINVCIYIYIYIYIKQTKSSGILHSSRMWNHVIPINQPTRCNIFSSLLLDVYVQLNMFRTSSRSSSGAHQLQ